MVKIIFSIEKEKGVKNKDNAILHKIKYIIKVKNIDLNNLDENYMNLRIYSVDDSSLDKFLLIYVMFILVRTIFKDQNKYCHQVLLQDNLKQCFKVIKNIANNNDKYLNNQTCQIRVFRKKSKERKQQKTN